MLNIIINLLCHRAERSNVGRSAQDIRDLSDNRVFQRQKVRFWQTLSLIILNIMLCCMLLTAVK